MPSSTGTPQDTQQKTAATYNSASDVYDHPANSFWDHFGQRTVERVELAQHYLLSCASLWQVIHSRERFLRRIQSERLGSIKWLLIWLCCYHASVVSSRNQQQHTLGLGGSFLAKLLSDLFTGCRLRIAVSTALFILLIPIIAVGQAVTSCAQFNGVLKATYNFKPSKLTEARRDAKSAEMDKFWAMVKANRGVLLPCLTAALESPDADQWFRFDGSNLLVSLDPSSRSKALQVAGHTQVDLNDVNLQIWVSTLAQRGVEGFNISDAATRWLHHPNAGYIIPLHGLFEVKHLEGAMFLFGSMDESQATPALLKIVEQSKGQTREYAVWILMSQATPESLRALKQMDTSSLSGATRNGLRKLLTNPERFKPRAIPKTTRAEFLTAFQRLVDGDWRDFMRLVSEVPDGEKDVVAVLKPEDVPLVRKVRRKFIANSNQHALDYYTSFTQILMTMIWKPELLN